MKKTKVIRWVDIESEERKFSLSYARNGKKLLSAKTANLVFKTFKNEAELLEEISFGGSHGFVKLMRYRNIGVETALEIAEWAGMFPALVKMAKQLQGYDLKVVSKWG